MTAEQITEACLDRIAANPALNAFILVMADSARDQARSADRELAAGVDRGPLHGVPISVKDLIDISGTATTAASRVRGGCVADRDAAVIANLRQAGAVLIGKTNLHEFAFGTTNEESAFGPARNPHDLERSPGGSSGGSAASVAAGMALASIGTDTGGSIRIPSAACGIVGLKPAFGEVSTDGVVPLSVRLDHVGPLAQTVTDAWLVYGGLRGSPRQPPSPRAVSGLRFGVLREYFCDLLEDEVRTRFDEALDRLRTDGARIEELGIPHAGSIARTYLRIVLRDAYAYHAATIDGMPDRYSDSVRARLELGRDVSSEDDAHAMADRATLTTEVDRALRRCDALILPTLPIAAPLLGQTSVRFGSVTEPLRNVMLRQTQLFNVTGHPAIAVPAGWTAGGLPCSIQLAATRTDALFAVAASCERQMTGDSSPRSGRAGG